MAKTELQKAIDNIEIFKKLVREKVIGSGNRANQLLLLVDKLEEPLLVAPASTRTEYQGAYPGGLVEHSLNVVKTMAALNKAYEANLQAEEIVVTGLFHDIGKIGNGKKDYYLPKNSDWHNKQGIMYETNPDFVNTPVSLRSLYLLQSFGIALEENEHYAISSIRDRARPGEESLPVGNEPMLAVVLQQAVRTTALRNRGRTSLLGYRPTFIVF
jgi:response regulator RpfG family c-di-GMP phosphodiesterase